MAGHSGPRHTQCTVAARVMTDSAHSTSLRGGVTKKVGRRRPSHLRAPASPFDAIPAAIVTEFNEWLSRLEKWEATSAAETAAAHKLLEERGWPNDTYDRAIHARKTLGNDELWAEFMEAMNRAYREVLSPDRLRRMNGAEDEEMNEIQTTLSKLSDEILGFEPMTLGDLAAQARAVQYIESEWWGESDAPAIGEQGYAGRRLVENIIRMARQREPDAD